VSAADVSQNLQGYDQMCKWAGRLYCELRKAFMEGRGVDPKPNWVQNQIGFLQFYLAPLSQRLNATGAYGPLGSIFGEVVQKSHDRWLVEGAKSSNKMFNDGLKAFPGNDEWANYLGELEAAAGQAEVAAVSVDVPTETAAPVDSVEDAETKGDEHLVFL
jgi:hypothetical protein